MNCGQVVDFVSEPKSDLLPYAYINTQGIWRNTQKTNKYKYVCMDTIDKICMYKIYTDTIMQGNVNNKGDSD